MYFVSEKKPGLGFFVQSHLCDTLEKVKLWGRQTDQWLPGSQGKREWTTITKKGATQRNS